MHELGVVSGIIDVVLRTAREAQASRVVAVSLRICDMRELVPEALDFAWRSLRDEHELTRGAELRIERVSPRSACIRCGAEFDHDRLRCRCPICGSGQTLTLRGRELDIISVEIDSPD